MHRSLAITSAAALLLVVPSSTRAADLHAPRLELPASWFSVVEPYRYDESRRYERGWNRGADVEVSDGRVRAPASGRVRFAGDVAGRSVVTIETRVDGLPVVVTLTGLDRWSVAEGDRVRRGAIVGSGRGVHIGMYDQARRSRYLPVVGVRGGDGAVVPAEPARDRSSREGSPLADVVASRLLAAIRGDVAGAGPITSGGAADRAPRGVWSTRRGRSERLRHPLLEVPVGVTVDPGTRSDRGAGRPVGLVPARDLADLLVSPARRAPDVLEARGARGARGGDVRVALNEVGAVPVLMVEEREPPRSGRGHVSRDAGGMRADARADLASPPVGDATTPRPAATTAESAVVDEDLVNEEMVDEDMVDDVVVGGGSSSSVEIAPEVIDDTSASGGTVEDDAITPARWSIPASIGALVAIVLLAVRRRTHTVTAPATRIARPLPPILPTMHPRPSATVRTDGHSIIGGAPLAWADHEAGTSTHHEPELLRHDADLLPERAAAPGPRVHDDRRGRDHPLPAAHGS